MLTLQNLPHPGPCMPGVAPSPASHLASEEQRLHKGQQGGACQPGATGHRQSHFISL